MHPNLQFYCFMKGAPCLRRQFSKQYGDPGSRKYRVYVSWTVIQDRSVPKK
jgi:hypothetical protein